MPPVPDMRYRVRPTDAERAHEAACMCPDMGRCGPDRDLEGQGGARGGAGMRAAHRVDFESAATYLPSVALVVWLSLHAAATCLCEAPTTVAVVSFTANWMMGPALVGPWKQVRHGVSVWLAWIAYGELIVARLPDGAGDRAHMLVSNCCWAASVLLVTTGARPAAGGDARAREKLAPGAEAEGDEAAAAGEWSARVTLATLAIFVGLFFPVQDSSFSHAHCGVRIAKGALFSAVFSAVHLLEPHQQMPERHTQRVTAATAWILLAHHNMLPAIALQLAVVVYANRDIFGEAGGGAAAPDWDEVASARDEAALRAADPGQGTQQWRGMNTGASMAKKPPLMDSDKVDVERLRRAAAEQGLR
jgi:hypothetical protein